MSPVNVRYGPVQLQNPVFVEGLSGLGLVGKLATDHLVDQLGMAYYAGVECPSLPAAASYRAGAYKTLPPVRITLDRSHDLLALQADVAVSPQVVTDFASCLTGFLVDHDAFPVYASALGTGGDPDDDRSLFGVATGTGRQVLADHGIAPPEADGLWQGPTGALLDAARRRDLAALGLIVEADPEFPDPEAACTLIEDGIAPILGTTIHVDPLRERAAAIREERKALADQMREPGADESSRVESLRMYH